MRVSRTFAALSLPAALWGCSSPINKPAVLDPALLARTPLPADFLKPSDEGERIVVLDTGWFADVDPAEHLTFAGYREHPESVTFCMVLACEPARDRLALLLLEAGESPLEVLADEPRRRQLQQLARAFARGDSVPAGQGEVIELSLEAAIAKPLLGSPLPPPGRIFAVVANYPSHLTYDLAVRDVQTLRPVISAARPRVFLKYPVVPPPGVGIIPGFAFEGIIGPYDEILYPARITVEMEDGSGPIQVPTRLDYEVEIGAVMGRALDWEMVRDASDGELCEAVAGLVLMNDTKARNPQVFQKIKDDDRLTAPDNPYRFSEGYLDRASPIWTRETCRWWSYAASWGNYTSIGPFFVAAPPSLADDARAVVSARSYATAAVRGAPVPRGRSVDALYLRQCSMTTQDPAYEDRLLWTLPQIIRSILEPPNALAVLEDPVRIQPGDIICLGTPGGTVITSKPYGLFDLLEDILFIWDPLTWHNIFFTKEANLYLRTGDQLFLWAEGLGFQLLTVREVAMDLEQ